MNRSKQNSVLLCLQMNDSNLNSVLNQMPAYTIVLNTRHLAANTSAVEIITLPSDVCRRI